MTIEVGEFRQVLRQFSECRGEFEESGLPIFSERGYMWARDYRNLIMDEVIEEKNWRYIESKIRELSKRRRLVWKNNEMFLQVYTPVQNCLRHLNPSPLPGAIGTRYVTKNKEKGINTAFSSLIGYQEVLLTSPEL